jgi:hypothetical protein
MDIPAIGMGLPSFWKTVLFRIIAQRLFKSQRQVAAGNAIHAEGNSSE